MVRDAGQIPPLAKMRNVNDLSTMANLTLNIPPNNNLTTQVPGSTGFEYMALDHHFQQFGPLQGDSCSPLLDGNTWNNNNGGGMGFVILLPIWPAADLTVSHRYIDQSSTPALSPSTSTSVTHSPSSSDHDWEVHYQSISDIGRLVATYTDTTFYERPLNIPQGQSMPDAVFGCLEPPTLIQGMLSAESESSRILELQYPTPVTPIGMEKLETVVDSSTLAR